MLVHWWHPGTIIAQDDNGPLLDPGNWFARNMSAWSDGINYFGQIDGSFSFFPFMALAWLLYAIAGAGLGQVLLYYLLVAAAWIGAFCVIRRAGGTVAAATAGAWLYTINPFTQLIVGSLSSTQTAFIALLPWVAFFVLVAAQSPQRGTFARAMLAVVALVALPVLGVTPLLVVQMAVSAVLVAVFGGFFTHDVAAFARWAAVTAGVMIAISLWWLVPDILSFVGAVIPHPTSLAGNAWTYARSSLLNNERFNYMWTWAYPEYVPNAHAYDANPLVYAAGFLPFAGGLCALVVLRGRLRSAARFAMACVLAIFFLSKGSHPPLAFLSALLWKVPGVFFFDDPDGMLVFALLVLAVLCALALDTIAARAAAWARIAAAATVAAGACLSGILLVTGAVEHGPVHAPDGFDAPSVYVRVPAYWSEAARYLNGSAPAGGVLLLPPILSNGYDVFYRWGYYGVDGIAPALIRRPLLELDQGLYKGLGYIKHRESQAVADEIYRQFDARSPRVAVLLRDIGVRYVLFRSDFYDAQRTWLSDAQIHRVLGVEPKRFGALSLYDLGAPEPRLLVRRAGGERLVVLSQLYSPSWIAPEVGHGVRFPTHVELDGWRNGWLVQQGGRLLLVNAVVILEIVGLTLAVGVTGWCVLRAVR